MATDVKVTLKQEGAQSFSQAFKESTASVRALDSALKLNAAEMQNSDDAMGLMKQKANLLSKEIEEQEKVVKLAREELARLKEEHGEGSTEVSNYTKKVNDAATKLEKLKTELNNNEKAMDGLNQQTKITSESFVKLGDSISSFGSKIKWVSAGATVALGAMFNDASDLNENLNKTQVVFDELSDDIEAFSRTTLKSFGIAQSTGLEMISTFGDMATSMGLTQEQAAEMGKELVGRAGDLASFKNVSLEVAQTGLSAIFTGQAESLKKFGIVMTEANLNAYAMAEGFTKTYKEMSQSEQVMLRYQYVMEMTKNAAGDFANTSDGAANSVRVMQESLKEASASLGQELLPLVVPLIQDLTEIIRGVNELDDGTKKLIVEGVALVAVASPILTIGGKIISGIGWIAGNGLPAITTALGTAEAAGTTALGSLATSFGITTAAAASLLGVIAAVAAAAVAAIAVLQQLNKEQSEYEQIQRYSALTAGKQKISEADRQYYRPEDLISIWNGSEFEHYANVNSISAEGYNAKTNAAIDAAEVSNTYNFDVNVANVDDLQDLLDMADSAQMLNRMGAVN